MVQAPSIPRSALKNHSGAVTKTEPNTTKIETRFAIPVLWSLEQAKSRRINQTLLR